MRNPLLGAGGDGFMLSYVQHDEMNAFTGGPTRNH